MPLVAVVAVLLGAVAGIVAYGAIRDEKPRIIGAGSSTLTFDERGLARTIPSGVSCDRTDPPSPDFVAGFICRRPDPRVDWVAYYAPRSAFRMGPHVQDVAEGLGLNADGGALLPEGSCSTPPAVNEWRRQGQRGHRWLRPDGRQGDGRVLCYRGTRWAAIEWTDRDASVYSVAYGPDLIRLRKWWETTAGPELPQ